MRLAVLHFDDGGRAVIDILRKYSMPGLNEEIDCDELFAEMASRVRECGQVPGGAGFCFSYTAEIMPGGDGKILALSKEIRIAGAEGRMIGEGINAALVEQGASPKRFTVLNDTVAAMLCGIGCGEKEYDGYIGFVLGTGMNSCYMESVSEIAGVGGAGSMAVNLESGCYSGFPQGDFDRELDAASRNPGDHLAEKMLSGAYLGEIVTRLMRGAAEEGLFSTRVREKLDRSCEYTTADISDFLDGKGELTAVFESAEDRETLLAVVDDCLERAARIITVNLAAILTKMDRGRDPAHPVCVAAEGTTFRRTELLHRKVEKYMRTYLRDRLGFYCEIVETGNAALIGAAVAALLNK